MPGLTCHSDCQYLNICITDHTGGAGRPLSLLIPVQRLPTTTSSTCHRTQGSLVSLYFSQTHFFTACSHSINTRNFMGFSCFVNTFS